MQHVLITGAAGHIGKALRNGLYGRYVLHLLDLAPQAPARENEFIHTADITRLEQLMPLMKGIDAVVHLAGVPDEAKWETVRDLNIDGCFNVFEAARVGGVKRFVFASSNHAVGYHRRTVELDDGVDMRPDSRYGVSKVFGEALGHLYADKHGMQVACLRIGSFRPDDRPSEIRHLYSWISHRDTVQLVQKCIDHPNFHFVVLYGVSNNTRSMWSNANAATIGYAPVDDAEPYAEALLAAGKKEDPREALFHGGFGCLNEFDGDLTTIP